MMCFVSVHLSEDRLMHMPVYTSTCLCTRAHACVLVCGHVYAHLYLYMSAHMAVRVSVPVSGHMLVACFDVTYRDGLRSVGPKLVFRMSHRYYIERGATDC